MLKTSSEVIEIKHPRFTARVSVRGAQLLSFAPKGGADLLWCTTAKFLEAALAEQGKPIRGGIPICWPWFGAHPERTDLPSHGFARLMDWELLGSEDFGDFHQLVFELKSSEQTIVMWPYAFTARVMMKLGDTCTVQLTVETEGKWTAALHTYLAVDNLQDIRISGLGRRYLDNLDNVTLKVTLPELKVEGPTEKMFVEPEDKTQVAMAHSGCITMHHEGHTDMMLWTPWTNAGTSPSDMPASDYSKMVCIETSRIQQPQRTGTLSVRLEHKN